MTAVISTFTPKITSAIIAVDPPTAARWLEANTHNRKLSQYRITEYAIEMLEGRWHFNGEPIQFDTGGVLLNGQHRLHAVIESETTQTFVVVRGLHPDTQITMDQGTRRGTAAQLQIAGIHTDNTTAAGIRVYLRWQTGRLFGDQTRHTAKVTNTEVVEWSRNHPSEIETMRSFTAGGIRTIPVVPSIALAVALKFHEIDPDDAGEFLASLRTGANLSSTSPILALRTKLSRIKDTRLKLPERDLIAFFVSAWNAQRAGRPVGKLQRPHGSSWTAANFPEPK